ncbi:MAG: GNAT family N-acetyltransferase [Pseudomonadota bacterium]
MDLTVRHAEAGEAPELAALHVRVWRATYGGLAPQVALHTLDEAKRLPVWEAAIAEQRARVATHGDTIIAAACFGPSTHAAFDGRCEIKHLYVDLVHQGHGVGQRLLSATLKACRVGFPERGVALAVVRQNDAARAFYKRQGGAEIATFTDPGPLWRSDNIVVAWDEAPFP